jgi:hypothetical protein
VRWHDPGADVGRDREETMLPTGRARFNRSVRLGGNLPQPY